MHCIAIFHTIDGMNLSNYLTFPCAYDIAVQQLELLGDGAGMDSVANQKKNRSQRNIRKPHALRAGSSLRRRLYRTAVCFMRQDHWNDPNLPIEIEGLDFEMLSKSLLPDIARSLHDFQPTEKRLPPSMAFFLTTKT